MSKEFNVVIEKDTDGYFVASIASLQGCHTQAKSLDILMERIQEAAELCLEFDSDDTNTLEFVGIHKITVNLSN
jgi:predicted RNase H-like HicB family nuclease